MRPRRPRCRRSQLPLSKRLLLPAATLAAAVLLVAITIQLVWWSPLNVDEELTLRLAQFSAGHIVHIVSTKRGGGPLHFLLEHVLQHWGPGIGALRIPSLVFLCLALPAVALVERELVGDEGAAAVVLLFAVSPIPVLYATFGRPHTLLFAWLMWSTVLALRAARTGERRWWIVAGAALGLSVFVHPTAPLYALTIFAASVVYVPRAPRRVLAEAWPGALALLVTFVPYYVLTLHVLSDRYGVGTAKPGSRTFSGRPVWEDALHFVAPGKHDLNYFSVFALAGIVALLVRKRLRVLAFCVVVVAVPVLFFSFVPANGDSALFFDRYMIPGTPAFLTLVAAALLAVARFAGGLRLVVLGILVAGLLTVELHYDNGLRRGQHAIGLDALTSVVRAGGTDAVIFGSTGTSGTPFSSFDYGHPANLLGHEIALRIDSLRYVEDDSCDRAAAFVRSSPAHRATGLWLFFAASSDDLAAGQKAFARLPGVRVQAVAGRYLVVRSRARLAPRPLVGLGLRLRLAWHRAVPENRRVEELVHADRELLARPVACKPYGDLDDPGISPHYPLLATTHQ